VRNWKEREKMGELERKVAIVTGAGRGIGRAIAEGYLLEGASVVVTAAREQTELDWFRRPDWSQRVLAQLADVTDADACEQVVRQALQRFGQVDVLVNNAARGMKYVSSSFLMHPTRFWETDPQTWRMVIATNVDGPFYMARAVVPPMLKRGAGSIINISVNYETMKRRGFSPYGPSKAALESETAIWAQDLADAGIRVNILLPGGITNTGMVPAGIPAEMRGHVLQPEIMVAPAVFLASDASRSLTGRRLVATDWNLSSPEGKAVIDGIGQ
jgi:NAD(P)-dependent dehydrogenase (short-subunit alcohol dehydrogenase family)